jgi:hypothetical protein
MVCCVLRLCLVWFWLSESWMRFIFFRLYDYDLVSFSVFARNHLHAVEPREAEMCDKFSQKVVTVVILGLNSNLGSSLSRKLFDYDDMVSLIINSDAQHSGVTGSGSIIVCLEQCLEACELCPLL